MDLGYRERKQLAREEPTVARLKSFWICSPPSTLERMGMLVRKASSYFTVPPSRLLAIVNSLGNQLFILNPVELAVGSELQVALARRRKPIQQQNSPSAFMGG